jgi:hypothetical protein
MSMKMSVGGGEDGETACTSVHVPGACAGCCAAYFVVCMVTIVIEGNEMSTTPRLFDILLFFTLPKSTFSAAAE